MGAPVGGDEGLSDGTCVGLEVGVCVGLLLGIFDGCSKVVLGDVGVSDGFEDDAVDGPLEGEWASRYVGTTVDRT